MLWSRVLTERIQNGNLYFYAAPTRDMPTTHVRIPDPVYSRAQEVKDEHEFSSIGEAIRYMVREGGYDV